MCDTVHPDEDRCASTPWCNNFARFNSQFNKGFKGFSCVVLIVLVVFI